MAEWNRCCILGLLIVAVSVGVVSAGVLDSGDGSAELVSTPGVVGTPVSADEPAAPDSTVAAKLRHEHHPTRLIVRFKSEVSGNARAAAHLSAHAARVVKEYRFVRHLQLVEVDETKLADALTAYTANPDVLYAEPDYVVHALEGSDDPFFNWLWGLRNTGQSILGVPGVPGADIRALGAWASWVGDPDFPVAVIDTGVNYNHPDLAANIWTNPGEIPGNFVDDDGNGWIDDVHGWDFVNGDNDPLADHQHGSHCSGTIGAVGDNGVGIVGVNWRCKIVGLKFLGADGSGMTGDAMSAVEYCIANGIRVSNNSWGGGGSSSGMRAMIEASQSIGHLFVAAAGNDGSNNDTRPHFPSNYDLPNVISVAATTNRDGKAGFSNWGAVSVDLGAPGHRIYSTVQGSSYAFYSGTSMATPHVAGAVALLMSYHPELPWDGVKARIMQTTRTTPAMQGITVTGGVLDIASALEDCNGNGLRDSDELAAGTATDCNANGSPDDCDVDGRSSSDCNQNLLPDECDIADGTSVDVIPPDGDGIPDDCQTLRFTPSVEYPTIQSAIDAAEETDVVLVRDGVHRGPGNMDLDLNGKRITVVSENGPTHCILDPEKQGRAFTFRHLEGRGSRIDGLTITNGLAATGGAILCVSGASPTIANCVLTGNEANASFGGGAIHCDSDSDPVIVNCTVAGNTAVYGGGITASNGASPTISNSIIAGNSTTGIGGGIASGANARPRLVNTTVVGNYSASVGGALSCVGARATLDNVIMWGNDASIGSQIYAYGHLAAPATVSILRSDIQGGLPAIVADEAAVVEWGDGNLGEDETLDDPTFIGGPSGTWTDDVATAADGMLTVLRDDLANWQENEHEGRLLNPNVDQPLMFHVASNTATSITVVGHVVGVAYLGSSYRFHNYHLGPASPCVDAGSIPHSLGFAFDVDHEPRLFGDGVDMGADEFVPSVLSSTPPDGAIDARQPTDFDGTNPVGWSTVDVSFDFLGGAFLATAEDFSIAQNGGAPGPVVTDVSPADGGGSSTVTVTLSDRIDPGARTCLTYLPSGGVVCLGYLPGDADGDGESGPSDILAVIDAINGVGPARSLWSTDIDRSGATGPDDIVRVIDLLNGAGGFDPWIGQTLP